jgi:hypothetical protein
MIGDSGLLPTLSAISIVSLQSSAISPYILLVGRRKTNPKTSGVSSRRSSTGYPLMFSRN